MIGIEEATARLCPTRSIPSPSPPPSVPSGPSPAPGLRCAGCRSTDPGSPHLGGRLGAPVPAARLSPVPGERAPVGAIPPTFGGPHPRAVASRHRPALGRRRRRPRRPDRRRARLRGPARRDRPANRRRAPLPRRFGELTAKRYAATVAASGGLPVDRVAGRRDRARGCAGPRDRRPSRCDRGTASRGSDRRPARDLARRPRRCDRRGSPGRRRGLLARGVVEGASTRRPIYRDAVEATPPALDEIVLVVPGARRERRRRGGGPRRHHRRRDEPPAASQTAQRTTSAPPSSPTRPAPSPRPTASGST